MLSVPADWQVRYDNYGVCVDATDPDDRIVHLKLFPDPSGPEWRRDYLEQREDTVGSVEERVVGLRCGPAVELRWVGGSARSPEAEVHYFVSFGTEPYRLEFRFRRACDLNGYAATLEAIAASFGPGGDAYQGRCAEPRQSGP